MEQKKGFENFEKLVQEVFNLKFGLGLMPDTNIMIGSNLYKFDLADEVNGHYLEIKTEYKTTQRGEIRNQINNIYKPLRQLSPKKDPKLIIVYSDSIPEDDKNFYKKNLTSLGGSRPQIFDGDDIVALAKKYNIETAKYELDVSSSMHKTGETVKGDLTNKAAPKLENLKRNGPQPPPPPPPPPGLSDDSEIIDANAERSNKSGATTTATTKEDLIAKRSSKQPGYDNLPEYSLHRLIRNVLDKEYNLNLSIELMAIRNGFSQRLDLGDEKSNVYVQILEKSNFVGGNPSGGFTTGDGTSENEIMINAFSHVENQIKFIQSADTSKKDYLHFAFFSDSYSEENISYARKWFDNRQGFDVAVLSFKDVINLAIKNGIDHNKYLKKSLSNNEEQEEADNINNNDKIPFHIDNVETIDRLNREPVAKSLARLVNNEIFTSKELNHSFMIHLQGEWGSGKSTFLNLLEKNLDTPEQKWIVVKYNAWQNQHILPPWWSFIDQIYRQAKLKFTWWLDRPGLKLRENLRRIIWYSGWQKIMTLVISLAFIGILLAFGKSMITAISGLPSTGNIENKTSGLKLDVFVKLIVSIGSVIGLIYSLSKFLSTPFLMKSSGEAKSFLLRASDPMNRIKTHFNSLISNINDEGYQIAVFIDDIDRCNKDYTISLLEGIQTLFKDKKVLYVVAGDKNWISTCFENNYKEFINKVFRNNERLGDLFLEKAFQLSVRMPNVSERTKEKYWRHILGIEDSIKELNVDLDEGQKVELKQKIARNIREGQLFNPELLKNLEEEFNTSEEVISDLAIETFDEKQEDIKHLFINHYALINPNPRSIKRLANNYTMYRNTLLAERKKFNPNKLFRWLILDDMYPVFSNDLLKIESIKEIEEYIKEMKLNTEDQTKLKALLFDEDNKYGGKIEIRDIKDILGI